MTTCYLALLLLVLAAVVPVASVPHGMACLSANTSSLPFCDVTLPHPARVSDFISRLTLAEKISLTGTAAGTDMCAGVDVGVLRLGVEPVSNLIECTGAVSSSCVVDASGANRCPTVFPAPLAVAASFNRTLMRLRGVVTGVEARALNNARANRIYGNPVDLLAFGPDLNLIVDPRNGRNGENPSEDGFLAGVYATEYVKGAQESADDPAHLQVAMSLKHFAGYQAETNRFASNFAFSAYDLFDTYLVPFAAGFVAGKSSGAMCSYNSLNNISACADSWLLTDVVRKYWGATDAAIMSDCGAVESQFTAKHTASSYADATAQSLTAGTDWCMGSAYVSENGLADALASGAVSETELDAALSRTLSLRFRLGMFDAPPHASPLTGYGLDRVNAASSVQAAEDAAAQGAVLLRNSRDTLPIDVQNAALKTVAVVGPHAISQRGLVGDFYGDALCPGVNNRSVRAQDCVRTIGASLIDALAGPRPDIAVLVAEGVSIAGADTSGVAEALAAVNLADYVVLAVGYDNGSVEHEGADHNYTTLPPTQANFSASVLAAAAGSLRCYFISKRRVCAP